MTSKQDLSFADRLNLYGTAFAGKDEGILMTGPLMEMTQRHWRRNVRQGLGSRFFNLGTQSCVSACSGSRIIDDARPGYDRHRALRGRKAAPRWAPGQLSWSRSRCAGFAGMYTRSEIVEDLCRSRALRRPQVGPARVTSGAVRTSLSVTQRGWTTSRPPRALRCYRP